MTNQKTGTESLINPTDKVKSQRKLKINLIRETDMTIRQRGKTEERKTTNPREVNHGPTSRITIGENRTSMRNQTGRKEGSVVAVETGIKIKVADQTG